MSQNRTLVWTSNHQLYYVIAKRNLVSAQELQKQISELNSIDDKLDNIAITMTGRPDPEGKAISVARSVEMLERQDQYLVESVIFAALTVEAYINYYAVRKSGSSHYKKYFDNLTPEQKWLFIPKFFNQGESLQVDAEPLQSLNKLVSDRNSFIHAKPENKIKLGSNSGINITPLSEGRYGGPSLKAAEKHVNTVKQLVISLSGIDSTVKVDWLDNESPERLHYNL